MTSEFERGWNAAIEAAATVVENQKSGRFSQRMQDAGYELAVRQIRALTSSAALPGTDKEKN